jgi:cell wall-associated NlpC family hydrolase
MKHLTPVLMLMVAFPVAAHAQIDLDLSGTRPVLRANLGGVILSAGLNDRGSVDWNVDDGRTLSTVSSPSSRSTRVGSGTRSTRVGTGTRTTSATASAILNTADNYVGTKYVWGGTTPRGFDCSGFVQYVYRRHGIYLPRTSRQQATVGQSVVRGLGSLRAGDLMFFATNGSRIDHIAIYAGNNQILHSSSSGGGVGYDNLSTKRGRWFVSHHVATRRVISNGQNLVGPLTAALRAFAELDPPDHAPRR